MKDNRGYVTIGAAILAIILTVLIMGIANQMHQRQVAAIKDFKIDIEESDKSIKDTIAMERIYSRIHENPSYIGDPDVEVIGGDKRSDKLGYIVYDDETLKKAYKIEEVDLETKQMVKEVSWRDSIEEGSKGSLHLPLNIIHATDLDIEVDFEFDAVREMAAEDGYLIDELFSIKLVYPSKQYRENKSKTNLQDVGTLNNRYYDESFSIASNEIYDWKTGNTNFGLYGVEVTPSNLIKDYFGSSYFTMKMSFDDIVSRKLKVTEIIEPEKGSSDIELEYKDEKIGGVLGNSFTIDIESLMSKEKPHKELKMLK